MASRRSASAPTPVGTVPVVQLPLRFQSPLPSVAQVAVVGAFPIPSKSALSKNADCCPGTVPPPLQPSDTWTCVAPAGAIPLTISVIHIPVVGLELGSIFRAAGVPIGLFDASIQI